MIKRQKTPGRNAPCPCGSGKKFKNCCIQKIKFVTSLSRETRMEAMVAMILNGRTSTTVETT